MARKKASRSASGASANAAEAWARVGQHLAVGADGGGAVRRQGLDGEGAGDADAFFVLVGLVVEGLELGAGGDRGVDLALAGDAGLPEGFELDFGLDGPGGDGPRR